VNKKGTRSRRESTRFIRCGVSFRIEKCQQLNLITNPFYRVKDIKGMPENINL
jgi:hypothetical protein